MNMLERALHIVTMQPGPVPPPVRPELRPAPLAPDRLSFAQEQIDIDFLCLAFPGNRPAGLEAWVEPTRQACFRWGIDTYREVASFLANINVESAGLTQLSENLNYSSDALIRMFGRHRISLEDANRYGRNSGHPANQVMLANLLYGGAWGKKNLGNTEFGDGWKHRGQGPKQLTGKTNQSRFAAAVGMSIDEVPDYIATPDGGMMSAGWFWKSHNLDAKAATPGLTDDRIAINGGTFGLPEVERGFRRLIDDLLRREKLA